ncbi:MAG TPA: NAD(P)-dependent oxidoreductase [Enteractinococcus helveticum]|uniref:NAD(P)-dependent oxidoreductase n=1 Tax=Enteractinococcus helveticum TaxID=1837282 RepID=A0A921K6D6_9MICC|nr:NAD(P)-dependent oxidoreductase [Enteractinococcus helveticum]HJF13328.1 NAD(P)-dependent oxidoreductase [Enteractinococcus helveticum]
MDLPVQAPASGLPWEPRPQGKRILITGAAGSVASLISGQLSESYELIGLDAAPIENDDFVETHQADLNDEALLTRLISEADYVLHLATGAADGKDGLYAIEIDATNRILAAAIQHGTRRVVLASSNHAAGWHEREHLAGRGDGHVKPSDPPRPDGMYGAAKAYMEALGRFASDSSGLPVSVLRIGTMRANMSLQELIDSDELAYLGFGEFREQRLKRTWLTGDDLVAMLLDEFNAPEPYRLRFATSTPEQYEWDHSVYTGGS